MPLIRDIADVNGDAKNPTNGASTRDGASDEGEVLDMLIVGAGFAAVYLMHQLRQRGFKAKIVEVSILCG